MEMEADESDGWQCGNCADLAGESRGRRGRKKMAASRAVSDIPSSSRGPPSGHRKRLRLGSVEAMAAHLPEATQLELPPPVDGVFSDVDLGRVRDGRSLSNSLPRALVCTGTGSYPWWLHSH